MDIAAISVPASSDKRRWWLLAVLLIVVASFLLLTSPEQWRNDGWFRDGGLTLDTADQLLHGKKLFSEAYYQYGPAAIEIYVLWCRAFGNSVASCQALIFVVALLNCYLIFKALVSTGLSKATILVTYLAIIPYFAPLDPYVNSFYNLFEKTLILTTVLVWRPLDQRSARRSLLLGVVIGLMQWVRFGSAAGVLAAVFLLDLILEKRLSRPLIATTLSYLAGFFLVEGALAARLFLTLPADVALDALWPQFMAGSYSIYQAMGNAFPRFTTLNFFIGGQLIIVVCFALALAALYLMAARRLPKARAPLLLPLLAFVVYCLIYYKQTWHYYIGSWLLVLPAAAAIDQFSLRRKAIVVILLLPSFLLALKADLLRSHIQGLNATLLPNGEKLWLAPEVVRENQSLLSHLATLPNRPPQVGVLLLSRTPVLEASHLYFFYQIPQPARYSMLFPGWLRQRDFESLGSTLDHSKAVVLFQDQTQGVPPKNACQWESHPYPHPSCEELSARLGDPVKVDDACWIFPVKPAVAALAAHVASGRWATIR